MTKQAVARATEVSADVPAKAALDPIDRLEEKIRLLVNIVAQLRAEQARSAEEHVRLTQEIAALRARLAEAEKIGAEVAALRDERELVRARVAEMLEQLEAI
jgi:regulator of replication initiation timing